jgi:hypothetical protein
MSNNSSFLLSWLLILGLAPVARGGTYEEEPTAVPVSYG